MSRPIRDAKDITTGQKVYFKGHAQATFMSDGRTVETAINEAMQGGGSGVLSADDVYIFEWDGEADSGTLSEAEVAKLWSAKSVVVEGGANRLVAQLLSIMNDVCTIIGLCFRPNSMNAFYMEGIELVVSKSGSWSITPFLFFYEIPIEETVTNWGFYKKPNTGIPESDLSAGVQAMLNEVYVFEWDGESESGTLSEAELAKLLSAKSVVVGGAGGTMMYADRQLSDNVCTLIVQFWQPFDATLYLSLLIWEISSDGNWTYIFQQYAYQIPAEVTETTVTKWGFYKKPSTGIPESDLSSGVQAMLNEVYVFEWDGESDSGTLSEAELAKLLSAKYVIISHSSGWAAGAIKDNSDDKLLILFSQTASMGIESLVVNSFAWEVNKTGEWTMQSDGATFPQPTEDLIKDMGFSTTDEVNTAIANAVTNALNTAV